jgi:hypothetical protein
MAKKPTKLIYWCGFMDGKPSLVNIDDKWGGANLRVTPAIFLTRKQAREQYCDVRKIELKVVQP